MNEETDKLLADRYKLYGEHADQAFIAQSIKRVFQNTRNWDRLSDVQKECLEMVANKLGRILNGDPDYIDSWDDIAGYVRLVTQRLGPGGRARSTPFPATESIGVLDIKAGWSLKPMPDTNVTPRQYPYSTVDILE